MRLTLFLAVVLLAGCASQPETPTPAAPAAAPVATPAPAPAAAAAATPAPQQTTTMTAQAEPKAYKPPSGYRPKKLGANTVYCKKDTVLGSRFPTEICMSEDELKEMERRGDDMRQDKLKTQGLCGGMPTACGNGSN